MFEGRFRFGVRDGPGVLTRYPGNQKERRVFKDNRESAEDDEVCILVKTKRSEWK